MITNQEKEATYKILKVKLNVALRNEFWFEACMIEYAIIEDRTSSILEHSGVCKNAYDESKKLSNKLNSIEHQIGKGHPIISRKVKKKPSSKSEHGKTGETMQFTELVSAFTAMSKCGSLH